eukprot:s147_g17.t1
MLTCAFKIKELLRFWQAVSTSCAISSGWKFRGIQWMTLSSSDVTSRFDLEATLRVTHDGWMLCFVIFGATPMLLGRPVLEQLGAEVDFGTGKMKILGGHWTNIERGKQDAMLLKLADNVQNISDFQHPKFDLRAKDDDHSKIEHLCDFLADLRAEGRYNEMQSEVQFTEDPDDEVFYEVENYINVEDDASDEVFGKEEVIERDQRAMTKTWVWMQGQLTATNQHKASLTNEARDHAHPRKKLIWEVYSGTGLLGEIAELMGAEVMRFGLHNGWDFTKSSHRRKLLQLADELEPDEIYMSPKCTLWSHMQAINIRSDEDWHELQEKRHYDHETSGSLHKALEREWIKFFGPPKQLCVDEWPGWGSDEMTQWAEEHAIEMRISPGQAHTLEPQWSKDAINCCENLFPSSWLRMDSTPWMVCTKLSPGPCLVNGYTPMQLALGRQPNLPGLIFNRLNKIDFAEDLS